VSGHAALWAAPLLAGAALVVGVVAAALLDEAVAAGVAGTGGWRPAAPFRRAALSLVQRPAATEHPDAATWTVAPAALVAVAAGGITLVPWTSSWSIARPPAGLVVWGTVEAMAVAAIYLHGWSPNAVQPLLAGYRFLAAGLSVLLLSMFVLIAAAIPARSLDLDRIVGSQAGLWNVVRQPLGAPLFVVTAWMVSSWGPLDLSGGADLSGGTQADVSGRPLVAWQGARAALLVAFAAVTATVFLGGWHGPLLPGPVWVAVKTLVVLAVLVVGDHVLARVSAERFVSVCWTVLLPLAALDLAIAGLEALS
jgi:NADH-quinone oxidoreductase subunit H